MCITLNFSVHNLTIEITPSSHPSHRYVSGTTFWQALGLATLLRTHCATQIYVSFSSLFSAWKYCFSLQLRVVLMRLMRGNFNATRLVKFCSTGHLFHSFSIAINGVHDDEFIEFVSVRCHHVPFSTFVFAHLLLKSKKLWHGFFWSDICCSVSQPSWLIVSFVQFQDKPLSSKVAIFNQNASKHQESQMLNPFSSIDGRCSPRQFSKDEYGK